MAARTLLAYSHNYKPHVHQTMNLGHSSKFTMYILLRWSSWQPWLVIILLLLLLLMLFLWLALNAPRVVAVVHVDDNNNDDLPLAKSYMMMYEMLSIQNWTHHARSTILIWSSILRRILRMVWTHCLHAQNTHIYIHQTKHQPTNAFAKSRNAIIFQNTTEKKYFRNMSHSFHPQNVYIFASTVHRIHI